MPNLAFNRPTLAALLLAGAALPAPALAETLQEALAAAYRDNPTLNAARAGQRATDETVPLEKSAGRPGAQVQGQYTETTHLRPANPLQPDRSLVTTLSISTPVYSGGTIRNGINAAKTRVAAGQFMLRGTELQIFSQVVGAYMDVIRDEAIVGLSEKNVAVLEVNLRATRDRFEVGDLTRTDVAQSDSRLALARGDLEAARSNLISARERYIQLIGHAPADLQPPPALPGLPASADDAVDIAVASNPDLAATRKAREAARYDVNAAKGTRLPTIAVGATGSYSTDLDSVPDGPGVSHHGEQVTLGATLTLPLYQGGRPAAQVRRTQALEAQAMEQETEAERNLVAQTRAFYASWQASNTIINSTGTAVSAAGLSLEGVRAENSVGTRTILDILNAEQEAFNARVQHVTAQRNAYVAGFSLLAAMGRVTATDLGLDGGALYDPVANYERVRNKWSDWADDPAPKPVSTRTVDSPTQNATVTSSAPNP